MKVTFALIKPHLVKNISALNHVLASIRKEFTIIDSKEVFVSDQLAEHFYAEHKERFFYNRLITFMSSGPSIALILSSEEDPITKWRSLMGPAKVYKTIYTNPLTIRGLHGLSDTRNGCHGSDSLESVRREIGIFFPEFNGALSHIRPAAVASDTATSIDAVQEFIGKHPDVKKVALFQCTSVFLREEYVRKAFEGGQNAECLFSITRSHKLRWTENNDGLIVPDNFNPKKRLRRQDWKGEMVEAGMVYVADRKLLEQGMFQSDRCSIIEIPPRDSMEIDTPFNLKTARCLIE